MTEQEKREKVIKGLECCLDIQSGWKDAIYVCQTCPYTGNETPCETLAPLMEDAIALLKAQEARVMTLEEVKQWCETHPHKQNPIWVEFQHGYGNDGWRVGLVNSGLLLWCKDKEARFWTFRPTEEQSKAVKWE